MKTNHLFKIIILLIILLHLLACESIVDVDLPKQESKIVVNSLFTPDSSWKVNISKSLGTFDNSNVINDQYGDYRKTVPEITNANVEIWEGDNFIIKLEYSQNGFYVTENIFPESNKFYQIKVSAENFNSITAINSVPIAPAILNVENSIVENSDYGGSTELEISFKDQENVDNYYSLALMRTYPSGYSYNIWFESEDVIFSGGSTISFEDESLFYGSQALFDDAIFDGKNYSLRIINNEYYYQDDAKIEIVLTSLSKELFTYQKSIDAQRKAQDNPFSEPVFIHGNIEGGLGIFGGYNSTYYKLN